MKRTPEEYAVLSGLLDQALDLPVEQRPAWIEALGDEHAHLKPTLRRLFAGQGAAAVEALTGIGRFVEAAVRNSAALSEALALKAGANVGPYELVREIGRGGMGSVWLARRVEGLTRRMVALKLPHPGLFHAQLAERIARERDILEGLTHPHIARLYDAGVSSAGQPYLALEYVEGIDILTYCRDKGLGVRERIELGSQVLDAVQYAHGQLIIHRDLKPANILVTAQGQVVLLDFGIAKLLTDGSADETALTQLAGRALTPDYASPEQLGGQPLGTASDVYSLGVVLFELLAGVRPYRLAASGPADLALKQITIPRASAVATSAAARSQLRGDVDTILLRALKADPAERYATASALGEDFARFLRGDPVLARPDTAWYRIRKFSKRNKLAVAAVAAVVVALATGLSVALWQTRVARLETQRAEAVQGFLTDIFRSNSIEQGDPLKARRTTAEQLLDVGARRVNGSLKDSPQAQEQVMGTLAQMYFELGLTDAAATMLAQRIDVMKRAYGAKDPRLADALLSYATDASDTLSRPKILDSLTEAKSILEVSGDTSSQTYGRLLVELARFYRYVSLPKGRDYADQAVRFFRDNDPEDNGIDALRFAGRTRAMLGDFVGAREWTQRTIDVIQARHSGETAWMMAPLIEIADVQTQLLDYASAEKNYRASLELSRKLAGESHIETLQAKIRLAALLHATARCEEGRRLIRSAFEQVSGGQQAGASGMPPAIAGYYGVVLLADGRPEDAETLIAADVGDLRQNYPGSAPLAGRLRIQSELFAALGRFDDARKLWNEARDTWRQTAGGAAEPAMENAYWLTAARIELAAGNATRAGDLLQHLVEPTSAAQLPLPLDRLRGQSLRAEADLAEARWAEAAGNARAVLARIERSPLRPYLKTLEADTLLTLGQAECRERQADAARRDLQRAVALQTELDDSASAVLANAEVAFGRCLLDLGDRSESVTWIAAAAAIHAHHHELGPQFTAPLRDAQRLLRASPVSQRPAG